MRISDFPVVNEIKEEYVHLRQDGVSRDKATTKLITSYAIEIATGTEVDNLLFWIGIADAQYQLKELSEEVALQGKSAINNAEQIGLPIASGDLDRRKIQYSSAPMPERKKVSRPRKFRCTWRMGDTFAYQLLGSEAEKNGLAGRYVLLRKVDELEFGDGRLLPVVTVTLWDNKELPRSAEEFERLPILKLENGRLGSSKSLYEYRVELLIPNTKKLASMSLVYLGNFCNVQMPDDEFIVRDAAKITMVSPDRLTWRCCIFWQCHLRNTKK